MPCSVLKLEVLLFLYLHHTFRYVTLVTGKEVLLGYVTWDTKGSWTQPAKGSWTEIVILLAVLKIRMNRFLVTKVYIWVYYPGVYFQLDGVGLYF